MTREQFFEREKARKRNNKLYGFPTKCYDMFDKRICFGDIVSVEFIHPNPNMYADCDEVFTVTEETVGWLKGMHQIRILSKAE